MNQELFKKIEINILVNIFRNKNLKIIQITLLINNNVILHMQHQ